jgi:hypothetical protein
MATAAAQPMGGWVHPPPAPATLRHFPEGAVAGHGWQTAAVDLASVAIPRTRRTEDPMLATPRTLSHAGVVDRVVSRSEWSAFFDGVMAEVSGLPVAVEICRRGRVARTAAHGVLSALLYDERGDMVEIAVQAPTPGRVAVMRHLITSPVHVTTDAAIGLLPATIMVQDAGGDVTRLRLEPSAAFAG